MDKAIKESGTYGSMMKAIKQSHSTGNMIRMLKLPLIFTDHRLYAGAIANFYWLTMTLETCLDRSEAQEPGGLVAEVRRGLGGMRLATGYEADLAELLGEDWQALAARARTRETEAYCVALESAGALELVAATFILYGALVVGGGKSTQRKVRKIFPSCEHQLFDVAENMAAARKQFKAAFDSFGEAHPEQQEALSREAARFMAMNNTVVISIRCLPYWWWQAATALALFATASVYWARGRRDAHR